MSRALGRYELLRPLARGGMAEVFLARRRAAGVEKWLVVKRMRPERAGDARFLDLFVREARLSMSLAHQNIVPVFDFGRIDDQVFLAMERVEGKDLGSSLGRVKAAMPPMLAAFVAAECCQALDYAHHRKGPEGAQLGIVHRDVTPRNVLLSWSGEVKLTDFGIASLAGEDTKGLIGTAAYMAPEQARGEPIDSRADIYALGLVLREAVTGERARTGTDRDAIIAAARKAELPAWPEGAPAELVVIADRATSPSPSDRYPDAHSMLEELDAFIVGRRAATKAESPARQLAAWLATVWGDDRELGESDDGTPQPAVDHLVSFLDDGALDIIGTGTERSLLATAAEVEDAPPTVVLAAQSAPQLDAATSARLGASAGSTTKLRATTQPRWMMFGVAGVAVAIGAYIAWPRHGEVEPTIATNVPPTNGSVSSPAKGSDLASTASGSSVVPPVTDAAGPNSALNGAGSAMPPADAAHSTGSGSAALTTERHTPAGSATQVDRHASVERHVPTGSGSAAKHDPPVAAIERHRVTINSQPWSYFTVDDDPASHQTVDQVMLAPGPHRIHFKNPQLHLEREITIDVADHDLSHVEKLE